MVVGPGAELAEAPFWDGERDELIWVDLTGGTVHVLGDVLEVDGSDDRVLKFWPLESHDSHFARIFGQS